VHVAHTEFGWVSILICGDLFDDTVKSRIDPRTQCLLVPMARSFEGKSPHLDRWLKEERQAYLEEVKKTGLLTLMVNLLEDAKLPEAAFGGALIVREDGEILAESPHGSDQALIFDLMPLDRERRYNPSQPKQ
jgi:predicted amidohydrolase